ncbi:MAG: hypothetical protein ABI557_18280 [Aureliella sp.]
MASIELRGKSYRIVFRFDGERYSRSLQTRSEKVALGALYRLEDNLRRVELGTLSIPQSTDVADFLLSDGMAGQKDKPAPKRSPIRTLGKLCEAYLASMPEGAIETNTRNCIDIHIRHLHRDLGRQLSLAEIDQVKLQEYVNKRSKAKGRRGMPLRPATIKKELATLIVTFNEKCRAVDLVVPHGRYVSQLPRATDNA